MSNFNLNDYHPLEVYRRESNKEMKKYPDLLENPDNHKGIDDDYDAFRHIYSSAAFTFDTFSTLAAAADLREYGEVLVGNHTPEQANMDLHNNRLGREIGRSVQKREDISYRVYSAIKQNRHIRLKPSQAQKDKKVAGEEPKKTGHYIWRTMRDGDVRSAHSSREGQVFSWDNPPEGGHPGEAHGCRCWAEPYEPDGLKKVFGEG